MARTLATRGCAGVGTARGCAHRVGVASVHIANSVAGRLRKGLATRRFERGIYSGLDDEQCHLRGDCECGMDRVGLPQFMRRMRKPLAEARYEHLVLASSCLSCGLSDVFGDGKRRWSFAVLGQD